MSLTPLQAIVAAGPSGWNNLLSQDFSTLNSNSSRALHLRKDAAEEKADVVSDFTARADSEDRRDRRNIDDRDSGPDEGELYNLTVSPFSGLFDRVERGASVISKFQTSQTAATVAPIPVSAALAPLAAMLATMCGLRLRRRVVSERQA